jgi:hypothetical protein
VPRSALRLAQHYPVTKINQLAAEVRITVSDHVAV